MPWTMYDREGQRKYLTKSERASFLETAKRQNDAVRTFCWTIAATGCRISEALALTGRNIDFEAEQIVIACLKKRGKQVFRAIPLPGDLLRDLKALVENGQPLAQRLWPWSRMTGWRRIREVMQEAGVAGTQATPKGLRHGFGVCAIQSKIPLNMIQRWLGHADIKTTAIYTSAMGPEEREIASRMWCDEPAEIKTEQEQSKKPTRVHTRSRKTDVTHICTCGHSSPPDLLKASIIEARAIFTPISELDELLQAAVKMGRIPVPYCHLIQIWLNCHLKYYRSTSTLSGSTSGFAAPLPPPWHGARGVP